MAFDRFLIAPLNTGLQNNIRPWLIPDDAFESLQNAYVFRGRVRKRFGSILMGLTPLLSRLRINIGTTDGSGNISVTVPGVVFGIGQMFSIGSEIFTVVVLGAPGTLLDTGAATVKTYNTTTGAVVIHGAAINTIVYFYPAIPVMGFTQYDIGLINNHPSYAFDTQFVYLWNNTTGWGRSGNAIWHGTDLNFFWSDNWQSVAGDTVLYTTNFNATTGTGQPSATDDPIWYTIDGSTWTSANATANNPNGIYFLPNPSGSSPLAPYMGPFVQTSRIIVAFKNRLILLNTIENDNSSTTGTGTATNYPNRARYSKNGSPLEINSWYEANQQDSSGNIAVGGGFNDATTEEQIISAEFIKDRLIVYFERSTWELAYTGNEILPFIWNKLNTELGSQSTFSTVPFDREVYTIGNTGIHVCNGSNVTRVDNKIPDEIFDFQTQTQNGGTLRTWGIRDYYTENIYWTFVLENATPTQTFPNQILVYNYRNGSWALNDDCFTAFGYFEQQQDTTWASSFPVTWAQSNETWESGVIAANQRQIIAGTPEGFVLRIAPDTSRNAPSMQITQMTIPSAVYGAGFVDLKVINHNCAVEDYVAVENTHGITLPILSIYQVVKVNPSGSDVNTITIYAPDIAGVYTGGGTLARVSNINILTKQYNPYVEDDRNVYLHRIDFGVLKTQAGQITVDYYPSATELSMIQAGTATGTIMGTSVLETSPYDPVLYPLESFQQRLWHPVYFQSSGECIQLFLYFSDAQMRIPSIVWDDFELEGMCLYTNPTSQRLQ